MNPHGRKATTLALVFAIAASMVLLRALPYLLFEQLAFDSDQAIVGLMAKHLIERRAFPLFFYGQTYMLAVEAWSAAPLFLVAGATISALRLTILAWNVAFVWLLIEAFRRDGLLSAWWTLAPVSLIALAPPSVATQLMSAQGGIAEPFVWIVVLWLIRMRPLWFGLVFAIAFRNREFTAYALPAVLLVECATGAMTWLRVRQWLAAGVMFVIGWQAIEVLKPFADLLGPGTRGQLLGGFAGSQIVNLLERSDFDWHALLPRASQIVPDIVGWFSGAVQVDTALPIATYGSIAWVAAALFAAGAAWLVVLLLRTGTCDGSDSLRARVRRRTADAAFACYLIIVGATAIVAFVASKPVIHGYSRYALLGLVLPVGLAGAIVSIDRAGPSRRLVAAVAAAWILFSASAHTLISIRYVRINPPNPARDIAARLIADGTTSALADYWRAYLVTFVAGEKVRVASKDFVRIQEYQDEFERQTSNVVTLSDAPCAGGQVAGGIYICRR